MFFTTVAGILGDAYWDGKRVSLSALNSVGGLVE